MPTDGKTKHEKDYRKSNEKTEELEDGQVTALNTSNPGNSAPTNSVKASGGAASIDSV